MTTRTKYVARHNGWIIGKRVSTIPPAVKTYTHAVAVWGHGQTGVVKTWCSRLDLAQDMQRKYQRYGFRAEILTAEIV
jgi:hypothetical protein